MDRVKTYWDKKTLKLWRITGLLIVAVLLSARYSVAAIAHNSNAHEASNRFNAAIQADTMQLSDKFEIYADTLYSSRALFATNTSVSRQDWDNFTNAQNIIKRYPAVYGLAYVSVLPRSQAGSFAERLNAARLPSEKDAVSIYPVSTNSQLAVLTYLSPATADQHVIGYDLFSSPPRARALAAARDSGLPEASTPLPLLSDEKSSPPSILIAMPIYGSTTGSLTTPTERQSALTGFGVLAVHTKPLLDEIFKVPSPDGPLAVTVTADKQVIYNSGTQLGPNNLHKKVLVDVAGQPWQFDFSAPDNYGLSETAKFIAPILFWTVAPFTVVVLLILYYAIQLKAIKQDG